MTVRALPVCPPTLTLPPEATVDEAMSMMIQREVNHIPLCAADGRFVGLISSGAILRALMPASARAQHGVENLNFVGDALPMLVDHLRGNGSRRAAELVDPEAQPIRLDTPLMEAANRLGHTTAPLPVVDGDGRLLGMLSRRMLLTYLLHMAQAA
jgi:CBS domain-containing protein